MCGRDFHSANASCDGHIMLNIDYPAGRQSTHDVRFTGYSERDRDL